MTLPIVAIIGRPNVGKSRLFNRLTGTSRAIVDDEPGVTRDRHYGFASWRRQRFIVVDTGGLIAGSENPLEKKVWAQAFKAIREADLLLCLFDGPTGVAPQDQALVETLRPIEKSVFYAVNKIDAASRENWSYEFSRLGITTLYPISAEHGRGVADLLEAMIPFLAQKPSVREEVEKGELAVAIVGRPNVGKSTLVNQLTHSDRLLVDESPGTTRDAIDVHFRHGGKAYRFVDTAGMRRKLSGAKKMERVSVMISLKAIHRAQIVCVLADAVEGLTHHDRELLHFSWEAGKGLILLFNKWDLVHGPWKNFSSSLREKLGTLSEIPMLNISALKGMNCHKIWGVLEEIKVELHRRMITSVFNKWLGEAALKNPIPLWRGRRVRFLYGTQVGTSPIQFVIFTNEPRGISEMYRRYLIRDLARQMRISGVPIWLTFRRRDS